MELIRFIRDLPAAAFNELRARYYEIALRHVGSDHPDAWLLTRRMLAARVRVNDFLSRWT